MSETGRFQRFGRLRDRRIGGPVAPVHAVDLGKIGLGLAPRQRAEPRPRHGGRRPAGAVAGRGRRQAACASMIRLIAAVHHDRHTVGDRGGDPDVLLDHEDRHLAFGGQELQHGLDLLDDHRGQPSVGSSMTSSVGLPTAARARSPASAARRPTAASRRCPAVRPGAGRSGRCGPPSSLRRGGCLRPAADARPPSGWARPCGPAARSRHPGGESRAAPAPRSRARRRGSSRSARASAR